VFAPRDVYIFVAGINTNDAVLAGRGIALRLAVPFNSQQLEVDLPHLSIRIFEGQRKITIDAVSDLVPIRLYPNGFGDGQFAVFRNADGRIERVNDFRSVSGCRAAQQQGKNGPEEIRCEGPKISHVAEVRQRGRPGNATCGTSRWAASESSK